MGDSGEDPIPDCCDVWWGERTAAEKRWVHWMFRDMDRVWSKDQMEWHYAVKDHQWSLEN